MNSNNNNENHEIVVYQHFNGRSAHSSVLFRLTCLLLLRYYKNHLHGSKVIVLLRYKQEMDYIEYIEAQSNLK